MRSLTLIAAAALLAGPVLAQPPAQAPAPAQVPAPASPPAAPAEEEPMSAEEAAFRVEAQAFGMGIGTMAQEMQAAVAAAGADTAKKTADLDAIQARYQGQADAFAEKLKAFVASQAAAGDAEADDEANLEQGIAQIKGVPAMVRAQIERAPAAPAAEVPDAPAAPPATPPTE